MGPEHSPPPASSPPAQLVDPWQQRPRLLLGSDHVRERIEAYALLGDKCTESKQTQRKVGALLREVHSNLAADAPAPAPLLGRVVSDLRVSDRTLRVAAARVLCRVAYESLQDQEAIIECQRALADDHDSVNRWPGVTVGWLHVLAVPDAIHRRFQRDESMSSQARDSRLTSFVRRLVATNYAAVYRLVSRYYAAQCHSFLPLCWHIPVHKCENEQCALDQSDDCTVDDVPDPGENLIAFFLVPRRMQFPESDAVLADEMLRALTTPEELTKVMATRQLFDQLKANGCDAIRRRGPEFAWLLGGEEGKQQVDSKTWASWSHLLVECCARLNEAYLAAQHGTATIELLRSVFRSVAVPMPNRGTSSPPALEASIASLISTDAYGDGEECVFAWEPVLIGTILEHPALSPALKRQLAHLQPPQQAAVNAPATCAICLLTVHPNRVASMSANSTISTTTRSFDQPWRHIVSVSVAHMSPITWRLFLAKWRQIGDEYPLQDENGPTERRASVSGVCSVASMRKSIQATNPRSYPDLELFRDQLPGIFRSQRAIDRSSGDTHSGDGATAGLDGRRMKSVSETQFCHCVMPQSVDLSSDEEDDDDKIDDELNTSNPVSPSTLRRIKKSSRSELDAISRRRMQRRCAAQAERFVTNVAKQRQIVASEIRRKREAIDTKHGQVDVNLEALELQRAQNRQLKAQRLDARYQKAVWRREQQRMDNARQQEIRDRIQRDSQSVLKERKAVPAAPVKPRRPPTQPQRPKSARDRPTTPCVSIAPDLVRERARVYGDTVRKPRTANSTVASDANQTEPAPRRTSSAATPVSPLVRRFSTYRLSSFRKKLASDDGPPPRRRVSLAHYTTASTPTPEDSTDTKQHRSASDDEAPGSVFSPGSGNDSTAPSVENACATLVMRQAALQVAECVSIPTVPPPRVDEPPVPPYVVLAQYEALDEAERRKFRARFGLQRVRHQLSFELLRQFTRLARRDYAWRAFHERASPSTGGVRHTDFVDIAQKLLGVPQSAKQLLRVARKLDDQKAGWIEWKAFYSWWCLQFDPDGADSGKDDDNEAATTREHM